VYAGTGKTLFGDKHFVNAFIVIENSDISDTGQLIFICDINIAFRVYKELTGL
jgi:hypothetical protein